MKKTNRAKLDEVAMKIETIRYHLREARRFFDQLSDLSQDEQVRNAVEMLLDGGNDVDSISRSLGLTHGFIEQIKDEWEEQGNTWVDKYKRNY